MLKSMRKHAKYFYFLFFLIILTFVFWGVGINDPSQSTSLAVINGHRISMEEYWRTVEQVDNAYRDSYGKDYDQKMREDVHKQVLNSMVQDYILAEAAVKAGLTATNDEVAQVIMVDTSFQENGAFSTRLYRRVLSANRWTPEKYEAYVRNSILKQKLRTLIEATVIVDQDALKGISGDPQIAESLKQAILEQKKQEAVQSYVNGIMRTMEVTINQDLIGS